VRLAEQDLEIGTQFSAWLHSYTSDSR
jgi:hypothetical protein